MSLNSLFYTMKPFIPRSTQIVLRRIIAKRKRRIYSHIWPIDPNAAKKPDGWQGWPDKKKFAFVLQHDVDTKAGHDKCDKLMELEQRYGLVSLFSIVPERYSVDKSLLNRITDQGFDIAVHGLKHDGKLFLSERVFRESAIKINNYLKEWGSAGFTSPSMHSNPNWMHLLDIVYSTSTFDTDPFEPEPKGVGTIFPFYVRRDQNKNGYIELPYTLPQDHLLFIILREKNIDIWKKKLDWIADNGGMALINTHPDYMDFSNRKPENESYPVRLYEEFLEYIIKRYKDQYWLALPKDVAQFWREKMVK